jgi:hypothetical protein
MFLRPESTTSEIIFSDSGAFELFVVWPKQYFVFGKQKDQAPYPLGRTILKMRKLFVGQSYLNFACFLFGKTWPEIDSFKLFRGRLQLANSCQRQQSEMVY